jgi:hypothetical protein
MKIQPEWIDWAKNQVRMLKDGAHLIFPYGAVFQINKKNKTLTTLCETPEFTDSVTQKLNVQVFGVIGYKVIRAADTPTNIDAFIGKFEEIASKGGTAMVQDMILGVAAVFKISPEDVMDKLKRQSNGNSEPINPITFKGNPSLSIGRLWIQSNEIESGQHVFAPMQKRENMDRTMQFVFWNEPQKPLAYMLIADERKFIEGLWMLDSIGFTLGGIRSKADPTPSQIYFKRDNENLVVVMDNITAKFDWDHVYRGLKHLFPKGELINPLAN